MSIDFNKVPKKLQQAALAAYTRGMRKTAAFALLMWERRGKPSPTPVIDGETQRQRVIAMVVQRQLPEGVKQEGTVPTAFFLRVWEEPEREDEEEQAELPELIADIELTRIVVDGSVTGPSKGNAKKAEHILASFPAAPVVTDEAPFQMEYAETHKARPLNLEEADADAAEAADAKTNGSGASASTR